MGISLFLIGISVLLLGSFAAWAWHEREDLFLVLIACLALYTIFTQIGYVFYPDIAESIGVYCGPDAFFDYWMFINLSIMSIWAVAILRLRFFDRRFLIYIPKPSAYWATIKQAMFYLLVIAYVGGLWYEVLAKYDQIGYAQIKDNVLIFFIFRQPMVGVLLYAKIRYWSRSKLDRLASLALFVTLEIVFLVVAARAGQRLVVWCFFVGLMMVELYPFHVALKKKLKKMAILVLIAVGLLHFSNKIVEAREQPDIQVGQFLKNLVTPAVQAEGVIDPRDAHKLIGGDYFVPSSTLFVMMQYKIIDFWGVIHSNVMNSLVLMHYPQLSEQISSRLMANATRNEGYAYYILNEGYQATGLWGFIYNAVMINAGFWLWKRFVTTSRRDVNSVMIAVIATEFLSIVRAPSFYFVKDCYLVIMPALFLCWLMCNPGLKTTLRRESMNAPLPQRTRPTGPSALSTTL